MSNFFDFIKKTSPNANQSDKTSDNTPSDNKKNSSSDSLQAPKEPNQPQQSPQPGNKSFVNNLLKNSNNAFNTPPSTPDSQLKRENTDKKTILNPKNDKKLNQDKNSLDLMTHLTQRSNRVFISAQQKVKELKGNLVDSEHLLHGLISDPEIYNLLVELKIQPQVVEGELDKIYSHSPSLPSSSVGELNKLIQPSPRVKRIIDKALVMARKLGFEFISPEHILLSLFEEGEGAGARILAKLGMKKEDLNKKITGKKKGLTEEEKKAKKRKQALEKFTIDLTNKASQGLLDPVVERSDVIERLIHILSRRRKNNPSLIGEAGVGKTAIVEGLAQKIASKEVPESLLGKRILQLDLMSIIAGASHRGEFEERMKDLIEEIKSSHGAIILFIDEMHNIVGAGASGEGSLDASNFLKPALARGELQVIGATTISEYRRYIEKDPALERRFQPVIVPEPTEEQAIKMLNSLKDKYEAFHRVKIPERAIEEAVRLSKRYVGDRFLPDKAVDLIDEAGAAVRLPLISLPEEIRSLESRISEIKQEIEERKKKGDRVRARILSSKLVEIELSLKNKKEEFNLKKSQSTSAVSVEMIKDIVSHWTGIPVTKITSSETKKLANLEEIIHKRLVDQKEPVSAVAEAVRRGRAGLKSGKRPIGSFVFLGPSGVGKTELAKILADILFGNQEAMIRFDMTEYMEKHEVAKLLGAPPGYVGYEEGGKLTEAVRRKPYSVVLFDEVEKAHPDVFNILLQILDDGRLTDNKGRVVSFKNTVVICTSNLGSKIIQDALIKKSKSKKQKEVTDEEYSKLKDKIMGELRNFFRPELLNRFDDLIIFKPLKFVDMAKIVKLQLKNVSNLLEDQDVDLSYTDEAVSAIVNIGFDPVYGARPLRRAIQKFIENPISSLIIKGEVKSGNQIKIDFNKNDFVFNIEKTEFVPDISSERMKKDFICQNCKFHFKTEILSNSTPLCPHCASTKLFLQKPLNKKGDLVKSPGLSIGSHPEIKNSDKQLEPQKNPSTNN